MLRVNQLTGFGGVNRGPTLMQTLTTLGLTSNLVFVLDAGDATSYPGSGQQWSDVSGNGNHYYRGTTSGSDATDPTFFGSPGDPSEGTYFSSDGGDYFTPIATTTFDENWSHNNGAVTMIAVILQTSDGSQTMGGNTNSASSGEHGVSFSMSGNKVSFTYDTTAAAGGTVQKVSTALKTSNVPNFCAAGFDEATTTVRLKVNSNACEDFSVTASTNGNSPDFDFLIGANGDASAILRTDTRLYFIAAWSVLLSAANIDAIQAALKTQRFPTMP